ncbi:hypothetical protein FACS1894181_06020 [Bacteroidia bacterium]|nr:hypothetical protein FACS1894181_06020 [Bacteroidia bacterium]
MKNLMYVLCVLMFCTVGCQTQNRLERAKSKMAKVKMKEFKREGWKLLGTSNTLEVALLEHYNQLKDPQNKEMESFVSNYISINVGQQTAFNNALIMYANLAGSTLRGRVASDLSIDQGSRGAGFDKMYAAYERLVEQEVKGVLAESFALVKKNGQSGQMRVFFLVNEEKAMQARLNALRRAARETELAQQYARQITRFVREGFEIPEVE